MKWENKIWWTKRNIFEFEWGKSKMCVQCTMKPSSHFICWSMNCILMKLCVRERVCGTVEIWTHTNAFHSHTHTNTPNERINKQTKSNDLEEGRKIGFLHMNYSGCDSPKGEEKKGFGRRRMKRKMWATKNLLLYSLNDSCRRTPFRTPLKSSILKCFRFIFTIGTERNSIINCLKFPIVYDLLLLLLLYSFFRKNCSLLA